MPKISGKNSFSSGKLSIFVISKSLLEDMPSKDNNLTVPLADKIEVPLQSNRAGENRWFSSSKEKITALRGEAVAIEKPAAAPPDKTSPFEFSGIEPPKNLCVPFPIAVPIWTQGPSVPSGTPTRKVSNAEIGKTVILDSHLMASVPFIAAMEVGMPPPRQPLNLVIIKLEIYPIIAIKRINNGNI